MSHSSTGSGWIVQASQGFVDEQGEIGRQIRAVSAVTWTPQRQGESRAESQPAVQPKKQTNLSEMSWSIWSWWCPGISLGRRLRHDLGRPRFNMSSWVSVHRRWWLGREQSLFPTTISTLSGWRRTKNGNYICQTVFTFTTKGGRSHQLAVNYVASKAICYLGNSINRTF